MDKVNFEWDNNKALINEKKHGITFEEADYKECQYNDHSVF